MTNSKNPVKYIFSLIIVGIVFYTITIGCREGLKQDDSAVSDKENLAEMISELAGYSLFFGAGMC